MARTVRPLLDGARSAVLAAILAAFSSGVLAAAELVPHRVVYGIKLNSARSGNSIVDAGGVTTLELKRVCDGWIVVQRMSMRLELASGGTLLQEMQYTGWESFDGKRYRFAARTRSGDEREAFSGEAESGAPGGARFKQPRLLRVALPEGTLFPVSHTRLLIDSADAGRRLIERPVFDGTEDKEPQTVSAFLGPRKGAKEHPWAAVGPLAERPGWNMRLAFYEAGARGPEPDYEIAMLQLDNGVAPRLMLDYSEFSVVLEAQRIEAIEMPTC